MAIENEELLQKLVRTGMIMRHIDGEEPCRHGHGKHHGHGCCHGHGHGHGHGEFEEQGAGHGDGRGSDCGCEKDHDHGPGHEGHGHHHGGGCWHHKGHRRRGQMRVIAMVAMQEGISQKDLAFLLGIRPQTLGEMLRKLEEYELVERKKSATDGRVIEVYLTDAGRTHAAEFAEQRKLMAADLFGVLTDEEKSQLAAILDKLDGELEKHRPKHHGHGHGHGHGFGKPGCEEDDFPEARDEA